MTTEPQTDPDACPTCGDHRDGPDADCANCGYYPSPEATPAASEGWYAAMGFHDGPDDDTPARNQEAI